MEATSAARTDQAGCCIARAFRRLRIRTDSSPDELPTTHETLQAIGRRLSRSWSEHDLTRHRISRRPAPCHCFDRA